MQLNSKSPEVAISGWLLKRCPAFGPDHWNKQWCVLYEDEDQDSWALDCYSDESARRKICHIVLGFAARVLPINSKHVPAVLAKLQYQRPCSFVLDSGEGRLCPFYVFDAVQKESLNSWQQAVSSCARDLTRRQKTQDEQDRAELIAEIFALLNPSGSGYIWKEEFRRYAETLGFWGSEGEWNTEFREICEDRGWKEEKGITMNHFTKFLSKDPDLSREELVELIEALKGQRDVPISDSWARQSVASNLVKLRTRSDVVNALFNSLQCKDTGRIGSQELQRYAKLSGFDGDDDDWAEEYEDLCAEQGWNKEQGLSRAEFSVLMNDDTRRTSISVFQSLHRHSIFSCVASATWVQTNSLNPRLDATFGARRCTPKGHGPCPPLLFLPLAKMDSEDQVGDLRCVLDSIKKFQKKLDTFDITSTLRTTLQDFNLKIGHLEEAMLQMQSSILSQTSLLQEVHTGVASNVTTIQEVREVIRMSRGKADKAASGTLSASLGSPLRPILKKNDRTADDTELFPAPAEEPPMLGVLPGELAASSGGDELPPATSRSRRPRRYDLTLPDPACHHAVSVEELSGMKAKTLLRKKSASLDGSSSERRRSCELNMPNMPSKSKESKESKEFKESKELVGERMLSLDELRANHDAQVTATRSGKSSTNRETRGGMPFIAELWLVVAGILEWPLWLSRIWAWCLVVFGLSGTVVLIVFSANGTLEADLAAMSLCYIVGVSFSNWMLRRGGIQEVLQDCEGSLDMYAMQAGFINQWRSRSRRRLLEAFITLILIWISHGLAYSQLHVSIYDLLSTISLCLASIGFVGTAYLQLHILSGLELAIDSFTVSVFRDMDFEEAVEEWNVLQAMLRHVSTKLSHSLLVLGSSCAASILYLIELTFLRANVANVRPGVQFILQYLWPFPPTIIFLYTLMRAAAVTEKASRVSPLVNSWTFESDGNQDYQMPEWMDLGRQYVVQYINQSEAGFYMQGVRLRIFQVTKMCYYLSAILFAVVSQVTS
eukprot:s2652_g5.t1